MMLQFVKTLMEFLNTIFVVSDAFPLTVNFKQVICLVYCKGYINIVIRAILNHWSGLVQCWWGFVRGLVSISSLKPNLFFSILWTDKSEFIFFSSDKRAIIATFLFFLSKFFCYVIVYEKICFHYYRVRNLPLENSLSEKV